jgi:TPR repeat protein
MAAFYGLVLNYEDGIFLWNEKNYKKYLEKAASLGYGFAYDELGSNYREGIYGYPKDENISFSYVKKGADLGNTYCCEMLSIYYAYGVGCSKDMKQSKEYAKKAKECAEK